MPQQQHEAHRRQRSQSRECAEHSSKLWQSQQQQEQVQQADDQYEAQSAPLQSTSQPQQRQQQPQEQPQQHSTELSDALSHLMCTICQELPVAAHMLVPCGHIFCGMCIGRWLPRKTACPTCRHLCSGERLATAPA
jgi:hypothetical protein